MIVQVAAKPPLETDCDREPIHTPGSIQGFGFLLALTSEWVVSHASVNIVDFTGRAAGAWLEQPAWAIFNHDALHTLRNNVARLHGDDATERCFSLALIDGCGPFDVAAHISRGRIIIEAEPASVDEREATALVRAMVTRLKHCIDFTAFFRDAARHVQALTGFDRVMVYQFGPNGDGEVLAEALRGAGETYLGLNYPGADIPMQARALYLRSLFRIISDVQAIAVPITPVAEGQILDQSLSVLRSVSPVHIQYLKNMGVAASLSISIIVDGKLWGLFACHHPRARVPSFAYRTAAELFGEMFSMMLEGRERRAAEEYDLRAHAAAELLMAEISHSKNLLSDPKRLGELLFDTVPAEGIATSIRGKVKRSGQAPDKNQVSAIAEAVAGHAPHRVFATDCLATIMPEAFEPISSAIGLLAIPLSLVSTDYVLLFRPEQRRSVSWAGKPDKGQASKGKLDVSVVPLSPRASFATWSQEISGKSIAFSKAQCLAAETLRVVMLEALIPSEGQPRTHLSVDSGQDILVAELNHRVRNILALIRGLISQSRDGAETSDNFIATLDQRVQALARAHDQITADRWSPALLKDLISTEASAFLGNKQDAVAARGPNVMIQPGAFTTLALVFHEMMTNAAKYGALADGGQVIIDWTLEPEGDLMLHWKEIGGPSVSAPTRRGFGSTIIERSIPYDLGGLAKVEYLPAGFEAHFAVPARHLAGISEALERVQPPVPVANFTMLTGKTVLLVEDSMIIALDCAEVLQLLGAQRVSTVSCVDEALSEIGRNSFDLALLDYNLGDETSEPIADLLTRLGVPFAFATGFDGALQNTGYANAPVVGKPYGMGQLVPLLLRLGFGPA